MSALVFQKKKLKNTKQKAPLHERITPYYPRELQLPPPLTH